VLRRWGVPSDRIAVIENWAPLDQVMPRAKRNRWSEDHGVWDTPVFMYSGTLGRKHDPKLLMDLATALPDAIVLVISEGAGTVWLRRHASGITNLRLFAFQPEESLSEVLGSADVLLVTLQEDAGEFSVPSKVLTYMAAGRPILACMPANNLAARTILSVGAGRVVSPSDPEGLVAAARELLARSEERHRAGAAGRSHAEMAFDIGPITDRFEEIFESAITPSPMSIVRV